MTNTNTHRRGKHTAKMLFGIIIIGVFLLGLASAALIYTDATEYGRSSHNYDIPDSVVSHVMVDTRGTAAGESSYITFIYSDGSSSDTGGQTVNYLSWSTKTFVNPNPSAIVTSIVASGGTHTYLRNFNAYTGGEFTPTNGGEGTGEGGTLCGNGIKEGNESCDSGTQNGVLCTAAYGGTCNYCSSSCKTETIRGGYCGDGILNSAYEECDDGNTANLGDKCTNECKKQFSITVEDFPPIVWQCDHRIVYDDATEPGRISEDGQELVERMNDYAFEGEQIQWKVLVMDKNGIDKVSDVYVTVDGNKEANCHRLNENYKDVDSSCNAKILEENIETFNPETMAYYLCTLTIETTESMYGQLDITVEAEDLDGILGTMDETESWFLNPTIELSVDTELNFEEVVPGTSTYSHRILVGNNADADSGVILDMFISGTDFYDSSSSGAKCPTSNQLSLESLRYYATNGAYSTHNDPRADEEGYVPIEYGIGFNNPKPFYGNNELIQTNKLGVYYTANKLLPGSKLAVIFRLNLPEPCNGDFDTGNIYFWGEAI